MKLFIMTDWKLYSINSIALGLSLTELEVWLKIILLVLTIGYTLHKWLKLKSNDK
jgi:hypothetical protein